MPEDGSSPSLLGNRRQQITQDGSLDNSTSSTSTLSQIRIQTLSESNAGLDPITAQLTLVENLTGDENPPPAIIPLRRSDVFIGRAADCQVTLSSLQISRRHCSLEFRNDKWYIRDTSTNGVSVAALKPIKGQLLPLNHGNLIQLVPTGTLTYRFVEMNHRVPPNADPLGLVAPSITIDSDEESLLSVADANENEDLQNICVNEQVGKVEKIGDSKKNYDQDKCEQDSIHIIRDTSSPTVLSPQRQGRPSIIFTPTKRPRPPSPDSPSQSDSQSSSQSQSLLCNKKQKTDINQLLKKVKDLEAENAFMKFEHKVEREDLAQQKEAEITAVTEQFKDELNKKFFDALESEFSCCVCAGVFVEPTISPSCGHTYCNYCITEWLKKKQECPICRSCIPQIPPPKRHVEMGNYIVRVYELLGEDYKEKREAQLKDRETEKVAAALATEKQLQNQRNANQMQFDMINEMQALVNMGVVGGRRARRAPAVIVQAAVAAGANVPPLATRRGSRRRNNAGAAAVNNAATPPAGLPGGQPGLVQNNANAYNHLAGMPPLFGGINPRTARHPFFQMPMPHLPFPHNNFLNNSDVMMID